MFVLSTHTYRFKVEGEEDVVVSPSATPQLVPDAIKADPMFALATGDGSLKEITIASIEEAVADSVEAGKAKPAKK